MTYFLQRLNNPKPLLLDGALGTEIERRGLPTTLPLWSAAALETNPGLVGRIHADYLQAGADIITTNTFRTHARNIGSPAQARHLTQRAVQLARAARDTHRPSAWVAGSVAPLEDCYSPHLSPPAEDCRREHGQLIENLASAGVDLLLIETMNSLHEALAAAQAARETDLPFMISFVLNAEHDLLSGESLAATIEAINPYQPAAILINCIPTRHISSALKRLRPLTNLPIGAYGNMGTPDDVIGWASADDISPTDYCEQAAAWVELGAQIIGSCCGSQPSHTAALRRWLDQHPLNSAELPL